MPNLTDTHTATAPPWQRPQPGFTLVELLIVVALLGVFAAIAVPSFAQFTSNNRTQALNNEMLALLQFARSTAVEQRTPMRVCKESGAWTVKKTCSTSTEALRTLTLPASAAVSSAVDSLTFRYNGTAAEAVFYTCRENDFANGYTITVQAAGNVRTWSRGKTGSGDGDAMTTCRA